MRLKREERSFRETGNLTENSEKWERAKEIKVWVISKAKRTFAVFYFLASDGVMVTDKHLLIMKTLQL